jgi:hypothetical protein
VKRYEFIPRQGGDVASASAALWRACELSDRGGGAPTPRCCGRVWFVRKKWLGPGDDRFYVVRSRRARNHSSFIRKHMRAPLKSSQVIAFHSLSILSPDFTCHSRLTERSRGLGVHRPVTESLEPADFNPPETFAWGRSVRRPPPPAALLSAVVRTAQKAELCRLALFRF